MEEIDVLQVCRKYKTERIREYLSSTRGKVYVSCSLISLVPLALPNKPLYLDLLLLSNFLINSFNVVNDLRSFLDTTRKAHEVVLQSDEYLECIRLYNMYISEIAMFLRSFGFKDTKELIFFLLNMYESNCLTYNKREYHNYKYGKDLLLDDFGIRAVDGRCVCRHTAHFFSDVLNTYGVQCCNLSVSIIQGDIDRVNLDKIKYNHMVNGIVEDGKKYIFDSTSYNFYDKGENETLSKGTLDKSHLAISDKSVLFNTKFLKSYEAFINSPFAELDMTDLLSISEKQSRLFEDNIRDIMSFIIDNRELVNRIVLLINKINPLGDKPIRKWLVK